MDLNSLLKRYQSLLSWNLARTKCFVNMILGVISAGSVQQHKAALGFSGAAKQASVCARIRNFLKSFNLNYGDYAKALVAIAGLEGPLRLVIDRTNWQFGRININLLVLAVVINDQFSIPLFWKALPKKGNSNGSERIDLLKSFIEVFGVELIACLMADREFIGKAWISYLIRHKVPFFIRIKENRLVDWGEATRHISLFFRHLKGRQKRYIQFKMAGYSMFFAGTRSKDGELVIVMSNQDIGLKILSVYKKRWTIELMFAHCKKNGFNLEDTHLVHLERIEKCWLWLVLPFCYALWLVVKKNKNHQHLIRKPFKHLSYQPLGGGLIS